MRVMKPRFSSRLRVPHVTAWENRSHNVLPQLRNRKYGTPLEPTPRTPPKIKVLTSSGKSGRMKIHAAPSTVRLYSFDNDLAAKNRRRRRYRHISRSRVTSDSPRGSITQVSSCTTGGSTEALIDSYVSRGGATIVRHTIEKAVQQPGGPHVNGLERIASNFRERPLCLREVI